MLLSKCVQQYIAAATSCASRHVISRSISKSKAVAQDTCCVATPLFTGTHTVPEGLV